MAGGAARASASSDDGGAQRPCSRDAHSDCRDESHSDARRPPTPRPLRACRLHQLVELPGQGDARIGGISAAIESHAGRSCGQSSPKCSICTRRSSRSKSRAVAKRRDGSFCQHLVNDAAQRRGQIGTLRFQRLRRFLQMLHRHAQRRFALERRRAAQHVVAGHAERVDVAPGSNGLPSTCSGLMYSGVPSVMPI